MNKEINSQTTLYSAIESPKVIIIFSHGSNGDRNTDFMKTVSEGIVKTKNDIGVLTYDFNFANRSEPSADLSDEIASLKDQIGWVEKNFPKVNIFLVGKSLGGVVSLKYQADVKNQSVKGIFMLGMPFKLGFPPNLNLLKEPNPVLSNYIAEYASLFKEIMLPVYIIQGDKDDLCDVKELNQFVNAYPNIKLVIVTGATHSFLSPDQSANYFDQCVLDIVNNI